MPRVYFHGDRLQAAARAQRLLRLLTGQEHDPLGVAKGVFLSIGFAALSDIKADFVRKARGGSGEDGVTWPKLSKKYLAYHRRFGRGEKAALKREAGLGPANRQRGLLTAAQNKRWKSLFASAMHRLMVSMDEGSAKALAAKIAWATLKREGAKTMLEVYGNRTVEILRDAGVLLNSLSPGRITHSGAHVTYAPPEGDGGDEQIMETIANGVIVGTTVAYASAHQRGNPAKGVPARPFLPTEGRVPATWLKRWHEAANGALVLAAERVFSSDN